MNPSSSEDSSMIEEYNELDFSDERSRDDFSSESDNARQLSADKLKYLGVDRFPIKYAQKLVNETQDQTYLQQGTQLLNESSQINKKTHNKFNIDSLMNVQEKLKQKSDKKPKTQKQQNKAKWHEYRKKKLTNSFSIISQLEVQSSEGESLITLPQPIQYQQRKRKLYNHEGRSSQQFSLRFEQAKLNFMDCFLPKEMKIRNNPYAFFKYSQRKNISLIR